MVIRTSSTDESVLNARQAVLECSDFFRRLARFLVRRASLFECFVRFGEHHRHVNRILIRSHPYKAKAIVGP